MALTSAVTAPQSPVELDALGTIAEAAEDIVSSRKVRFNPIVPTLHFRPFHESCSDSLPVFLSAFVRY